MSSDKKQPEKTPIEISHEEIDELKREMRSAQITAWLEANQQRVIAGVVAVIVLIAGISMWKEHRQSQRASAATLYHQAIGAQNLEDRLSLLQEIIKDYDSTVYGGLARLLLANADPEHAAKYLQALMDRSDVDSGIRAQARLDLARLRIKNGDKAAANKLLESPAPTDYEQLRQYLLAQAAADKAARIEHLKNARDAVSNDAELSQRIDEQLSSLGAGAAGQG